MDLDSVLTMFDVMVMIRRDGIVAKDISSNMITFPSYKRKQNKERLLMPFFKADK